MRKIPMRMCVVSREKLPKKELIRVVINKENEISIDTSGKVNGKGIYLKKDTEVIKKAREKRVIDRCLGINIDDDIYNELERMVLND